MTTTLITGANRGIGLEFVRQWKAKGHTVIGAARDPQSATELQGLADRVERLDAADPASVEALAEALADEPIDILINNGAVGPEPTSFGEIDMDAMDRAFRVNSVGPMRVAQALLSNVRRSESRMIVNITTICASIERQTCGDFWAYNASKAALNMLGVMLADRLRDDGVRCLLIHPGWVRTRMGGDEAPLTPEDSVAGMIRVIESATLDQSGKFLDYQGNVLPW